MLSYLLIGHYTFRRESRGAALQALIVTTFGRPGYLRRALQAGASGFVVKDTPARQLADAVVEKRPGTPVLYASGYTENVILHNDRLDPGVRLLAKPYSTRQLIERVGDLLMAEGQAPQ